MQNPKSRQFLLVAMILVVLFPAAGLRAQDPGPDAGGETEDGAETEAAGDIVRGELIFPGGSTERNSMTHWDEFAWPFEAARWGRYSVEVHYYGLRRAMGAQVRLRSSSEPAKGALKPGGTRESPAVARLGTIYVPEQGGQELVLFTPQDDPVYDVKFSSVHLVPAPEGEAVRQDADGNVILLAKDAATFSERMRYEPREEKNCLGFWTLKDDWAQWEFELEVPGMFRATVFQGCGNGNHGSNVRVSVVDESGAEVWDAVFTVEDTGGFQNWKGIDLGDVPIVRAGRYRLTIRPQTQAAKAVMDVQKVVLRKAGD